MRLDDFDYDLPEELIAQQPLVDRAGARMLVVDRAKGTWEDRMFRDFPLYIRPGDCLVLNDSRVFPSRLYGRREHGTGRVEVFLTRPISSDGLTWEALVRPGRKMRTGERIVIPGGVTDETETPPSQAGLKQAGLERTEVVETGEAAARAAESISRDISTNTTDELTVQILGRGEFGERTVRLHANGELFEVLDRMGHVPLPPYIRRPDTHADRERYQTVFARERGSVAAPTAGLHFTNEILNACRAAGATIGRVTLHVGLGTFQPLHEDVLEEVKLHTERFVVPEETVRAMDAVHETHRLTAPSPSPIGLDSAVPLSSSGLEAGPTSRNLRARVIAVGTTSVRAIESPSNSGETGLFIYPGFQFRRTDAMLTNFHLPKSSLLVLVSAFTGRELALAGYRHAVAKRYRFFSYGDCMLIL